MKLKDLLPSKPTPAQIDPAKQKVLLIAPPKFGKTTWTASFPDALFLCTEEGHSAIAVNRITIDKWAWLDDEEPDEDERFKVDADGVRHMAFVDAVAVLTKTSKFTTVIVDTLPALYQMVTDYICAKKGIEHPSDEGYARAWHAIRDEFARTMLTLVRCNRGVILISHVKHKEIEDTRIGRKITQAAATIPDACRAIIEPEVDIILHGGWEKDADGNSIRVWKCEPDESMRECGDRNGVLPKQFPCTKKGGYATFASFFKAKK